MKRTLKQLVLEKKAYIAYLSYLSRSERATNEEMQEVEEALRITDILIDREKQKVE